MNIGHIGLGFAVQLVAEILHDDRGEAFDRARRLLQVVRADIGEALERFIGAAEMLKGLAPFRDVIEKARHAQWLATRAPHRLTAGIGPEIRAVFPSQPEFDVEFEAAIQVRLQDIHDVAAIILVDAVAQLLQRRLEGRIANADHPQQKVRPDHRVMGDIPVPHARLGTFRGEPVTLLAGAQLLHHALPARIVEIGEHRAVDPAVTVPVGLDVFGVKLVAGPQLPLHEFACLDDLDDVAAQIRNVDLASDRTDRFADRAFGEQEYVLRTAVVACDPQRLVDDNDRDLDAFLDVFEIFVGVGKLGRLDLQLLVDGQQLFVGGLQFLVGRLELLVGRLELLIGRLHLLIGRLELLVGGLQFFDHRLEMLLGRGEFLLEFRKHRIALRAGIRLVVVFRLNVPLAEGDEKQLFGRVLERQRPEVDIHPLQGAIDPQLL